MRLIVEHRRGDPVPDDALDGMLFVDPEFEELSEAEKWKLTKQIRGRKARRDEMRAGQSDGE